ncbi:hypothetical protein FBU30_004155 [Linnemannia zychae]|nr:hypothetical protein FBU30_004155 [Linnemannia zychae]
MTFDTSAANALLNLLHQQTDTPNVDFIIPLQAAWQYSEEANVMLLQREIFHTNYDPITGNEAIRQQSDQMRISLLAKLYNIQDLLPDLILVDLTCAKEFHKQIDACFAAEEEILMNEHKGYISMTQSAFETDWGERYVALFKVIRGKRKQLKRMSFDGLSWLSMANIVRREAIFVRNHPLLQNHK